MADSISFPPLVFAIDILVSSFFHTEICHVGECTELCYSSLMSRSFDHKFSLLPPPLITGREEERKYVSYRHAIRAITKRASRAFSFHTTNQSCDNAKSFLLRKARDRDIDALIRDVTVMSYVQRARYRSDTRQENCPLLLGSVAWTWTGDDWGILRTFQRITLASNKRKRYTRVTVPGDIASSTPGINIMSAGCCALGHKDEFGITQRNLARARCFMQDRLSLRNIIARAEKDEYFFSCCAIRN